MIEGNQAWKKNIFKINSSIFRSPRHCLSLFSFSQLFALKMRDMGQGLKLRQTTLPHNKSKRTIDFEGKMRCVLLATVSAPEKYGTVIVWCLYWDSHDCWLGLLRRSVANHLLVECMHSDKIINRNFEMKVLHWYVCELYARLFLANVRNGDYRVGFFQGNINLGVCTHAHLKQREYNTNEQTVIKKWQTKQTNERANEQIKEKHNFASLQHHFEYIRFYDSTHCVCVCVYVVEMGYKFKFRIELASHDAGNR